MPLDIAYRMNLHQIVLVLGRDVSTRLIKIIWDAIKDGDLDKIKEVNQHCLEREQQTENNIQAFVNPYSSSSIGRRGFQAQGDLFKDMPYHQLLNLAALWAATRFRFDLLDFFLDQKALNLQ